MVRDLLNELLAGCSKLSYIIFHFYTMKVTLLQHAMQEKNDKRLQNCFGSEGAFCDTAKPSDPGDERPQKVQNSRLAHSSRILFRTIGQQIRVVVLSSR